MREALRHSTVEKVVLVEIDEVGSFINDNFIYH